MSELVESGKPNEPTLLGMPFEIREQILVELLIDKTLDEPNAEGEPKYAEDIHPAILQTCKQLYAEGSPILYEKNRFLACISAERIRSTFTFGRKYSVAHPRAGNWTIILKPKFWKSQPPSLTHMLRQGVAEFCCLLQLSTRLNSLRIKIVSTDAQGAEPPVLVLHDGAYRGILSSALTGPNRYIGYHGKTDTVLVPMLMLRNVGNIEFVDEGTFKLTDGLPRFTALLQSNAPVVFLSHRLALCLEWAQQFERDPDRRRDMDPKYRRWRDPRQPARIDARGPVESLLAACWRYEKLYGLQMFEINFRMLLRSLNSHTSRIFNARRTCLAHMQVFLKSTNGAPGHSRHKKMSVRAILNDMSLQRFQVGKDDYPDIAETILKRLKVYAKTFDVERFSAERQRADGFFDPPYSYDQMTRELAFKAMEEALERRHWVRFAINARNCLNDCDAQYYRIATAGFAANTYEKESKAERDEYTAREGVPGLGPLNPASVVNSA